MRHLRRPVTAWCALAPALWIAPGATAQTVWTDGLIEFKKNAGADWNLPENQDHITDIVWITRKNEEGLFNIAQEDGFDTLSPKDTEWASGAAVDWQSLTFTPWFDWVAGCPPCMVDEPAVVHLITDDIYIDITMTSWQCCSQGGFSYIRASQPGCSADANGDGHLNLLDFLFFQNQFEDMEPGADCDGNGVFNILDFVCFQTSFVAGCK